MLQKKIKIAFIATGLSILIVGICMLDYHDLSLKNNVTAYIMMLAASISIISIVLIKPVQNRTKQIIILNTFECIALVYLIIYIISILEDPLSTIRYLRLIPVFCGFAFAEMTKHNIRKLQNQSKK